MADMREKAIKVFSDLAAGAPLSNVKWGKSEREMRDFYLLAARAIKNSPDREAKYEPINKDFESLELEDFKRTASGLMQLSLLVAPIIMKNDFEGRGIEDAAQFALDLQIGSDAITEIMEQIYGRGAGDDEKDA